ncbi:MAG: hypothetical protein ABIJ59_16540 [Pseudomonadota bacterium]
MDQFNKLYDLKLSKTEKGFPILIPIGIDAISVAIEMIEILNKENFKELSKYKDLYEKISNPENRSTVEPHLLKQLKLKFLNRSISYITIACSIHGIFSRSYKIFNKILQNNGVISDTSSNNKYRELTKEKISNLFYIRNKIIAHTSFGDPRNDDPYLQINSLLYFSGQIIRLLPEGFSISANQGLHVGEGKSNNHFFTFHKHHKIVLEMIDEWSSYFLSDIIEIGVQRVQSAFNTTNILEIIKN